MGKNLKKTVIFAINTLLNILSRNLSTGFSRVVNIKKTLIFGSNKGKTKLLKRLVYFSTHPTNITAKIIN